MASRQLEKLGYTAVTTEDGKQALEAYQAAMKTENPFSAVIMDLTIPGGMGGQEAVTHLLKLDPEAVALVSTGYADDPVVSRCTDYGFKGAIPKPFTLEDLGKALQKALTDNPGSSFQIIDFEQADG